MRLISILGSKVARKRLWTGLHRASWPITSTLAGLYRRLLLRNVTIVTVVGSFGKTTTTNALSRVLDYETRPSVIGNVGTYIAKEMLLFSPSSRLVVLETGVNRPGQMARYARMIRPDVVVATSVGSEHNRSFSSLEVTRYEKSRMLAKLSTEDLALLNGDDPNVLWMANETRARVVTYGFQPENQYRAEEVELEWPTGTRFTVCFQDQRKSVKTGLFGRHMVYPVLAAVALGSELKIPFDLIRQRLRPLRPVALRLKPERLKNGVVLLRDEYKSAQETIECALDTLQAIPAKRRFVVMGEVTEPSGSMGPIYRSLGAKMGRVADRVIIVGHHFSRYASGARKIGKKEGIFINAGRTWKKALEILQNETREGDVVLIKGRGSERLDRITLALQGETVTCSLSYCNAVRRCANCPDLTGNSST